MQSYVQFDRDSLGDGGPLVYQQKPGVARLNLLSLTNGYRRGTINSENHAFRAVRLEKAMDGLFSPA
jgi:hypothetical protein